MAIYIGLDIGGTKTLVHSVNKNGEELKRTRRDTPYKLADGLEMLFEMIDEVSQGSQILGIGAAIGGPLDVSKGTVSPLHQPTWRDVPLKKIIEDKYNCPFYFDIDTNVAALSEYHLKGYNQKTFLYITLSTGMGGGFLINGLVYRGLSHPEIAHQSIEYKCSHPERIKCACGARNCLSAIVSGTGISKIYDKPAAELSIDEWKEVGYNLGQGLRNIACILSPEIIVFGGGVITKQKDVLLTEAEKVMNDDLRIVSPPKLKISDFDYDTALYGASLIAKEGRKFYGEHS
ncbi:ROK family protein [Francisella sp. LA112445]|uniref:ROK family protein n=1 Tax=Francisella sp. LA112445 TaxID=1395624 RepID=UPI001788E1F6|nr:ROK family protein [Francisella sp. LA112445]